MAFPPETGTSTTPSQASKATQRALRVCQLGATRRARAHLARTGVLPSVSYGERVTGLTDRLVDRRAALYLRSLRMRTSGVSAYAAMLLDFGEH